MHIILLKFNKYWFQLRKNHVIDFYKNKKYSDQIIIFIFITIYQGSDFGDINGSEGLKVIDITFN